MVDDVVVEVEIDVEIEIEVEAEIEVEIEIEVEVEGIVLAAFAEEFGAETREDWELLHDSRLVGTMED